MKISDRILDSIELFLDTEPDFKNETLAFSARTTGENPTVRMMQVRIGDETYLVVAKKVGA